MDPIWISIAFLLGFAARQAGLPPLVGFLIAGFILNAMGISGGPTLNFIADMGVTLLLFSIGLKLKLKSLVKPEVWAGAGIHMLITVAVFGLALMALGHAGVGLFTHLDSRAALLVAFALSFSSTVFAVKVLEERAEMGSYHGRVAIGILIVQDLVAVIFLTASTGKLPSPWALALVPGLFLVRPLLLQLMVRSGHGELIILCGFFMALVVGAGSFELVGLKGDLGALVFGILLSTHAKSAEMAKQLLAFKDFFLVGFFLSIGLSGVPSLQALGIAAILALVIPLKVALFFGLLTRFKLRARTAALASLSLANYSEFGLIVGSIAVANGWIANEWLVTIALALSISFMVAAPLNTHADHIQKRWAGWLKRFEITTPHPDDAYLGSATARVLIFGMGRVGTKAYDAMVRRYGSAVVIGVDANQEQVLNHQKNGRKVVLGDPTDPDFWDRTSTERERLIRLALLAMPKQAANLAAARQLRDHGFQGIIAATAMFEDELPILRKAGVDAAFNLYEAAGQGFVDHACDLLETGCKL